MMDEYNKSKRGTSEESIDVSSGKRVKEPKNEKEVTDFSGELSI